MGELEEVVAEAVFGRRLRWHWAVFWQAVLVWWYWQHMVVGLNPRGGVNVLQFWFKAVSWFKMQFIPCDVCGLPSPHLYCSCGDRTYCDQGCQRADWPYHRNYCGSVPFKRLENLWRDCLARTLLIIVSPFCTAFAGGNEVGSWKQQLVCILVPGEMCIYMLCMFIHVVITHHFFDAQASLSLYAGFKCYLHGQDFEMFGL